MYVQSHNPVRLSKDLMSEDVEVIWLQVHLSHLKLILGGSFYSPLSAKSQYLDYMCEMIDNVCDINRKVFFGRGDLNIDWLSSSCPLKKKRQAVTDACNLVQVISQPTRVFTNRSGTKSSTCIDRITSNAEEMCSKAISTPSRCSDHNIIAMPRKNQSSKEWP